MSGPTDHSHPDSMDSPTAHGEESVLHERASAGSQHSPGHLSQAISEHLACATGGSGHPTSAADVSPQDHHPLASSLTPSQELNDPQTAERPVHRDTPRDAVDMSSLSMAMTGSSQSEATGKTSASAAMPSQKMSPAAVSLDSAAESQPEPDQAKGTSQLHQKPAMEGPNSKRLKREESASEAGTSSSELNPADFGLASSPVWQHTSQASDGSSSISQKVRP